MVPALMSRLQIGRERSFHIAASGAAWLTIAIGALVVIAWHSHSEWLWVTFPRILDMKYNTALGFLAAGAGLLACTRGERTRTVAAGGIVLALGVANLIQHVTGVNLGFDQLLVKDYLYPEVPFPGRMAPNTALAFTCVGTTLLLLSAEGERAFSRIVATEVLSFVVLAVGTTAMIGYLADAGFAYSWGRPIARTTAVAFMILELGLLVLTRERHSIRIARVPLRVRRERGFHIVASGAALLTIAIGVFMMIAWHSHSEWLSATFPGMFYMKYNTSLAFIAGGAGLLACTQGERTSTVAAGAIVLAIGGITLTQYVTGVNLGFDELFLKDYWYPENPLRGRMAPSASVALTCVGIMLILLADEGERTFSRVVVMEVLGFVVLAVGTTAVVGYLTEAGFAYSWGSSARVSKAAAAGYVAMGAGLVALTWQRQSTRIARVPPWVPALLCFVVLLFDLSTPIGIAIGIAYIPIIFCSLWFTQPYMAFIFAAITSALSVLGYFAAPPSDVEPWIIITNRALTIGALWLVAILVYLRRRTELALQGYMDELERSNQELDDFAYIASHDLKEPLRGLFNHASFLLEDYHDKLDQDGRRRLKRLAQLSQRMEQLVNDLLYFSRLGRTELAVQETDLNTVLVEIRQMMEALLTERHARIIVPRSLPRIVCDKPRVTEIFRNLITNAVKYNDKAERRVEIGFLDSVNTNTGPERNVFYVKDNGVGIEAEFHQEVFRIFKRLQNAADGQESGTGVGLTFVKKIVERHGGRIWIESEPGKGTVFYFNLNRERQEPARKSHEPDIVQVPVHSHG